MVETLNKPGSQGDEVDDEVLKLADIAVRRLIDVEVYHGDSHGAPNFTVPIYEMPDGSQVAEYKEARVIRTGVVNGTAKALEATEVGEA